MAVRAKRCGTVAELLALAERDCVVGSSLTAERRYRWVVNDRTIDS